MTLTTRSGRKPSQNEHELRSFIALLKDRGVERYCEIGARHGDTFYEIMAALPTGSRGLAVDLPGALWGKKGTETPLATACDFLRYIGYTIDMMLADSQTKEAEDAIYALGPFDAVLIDADHTYDGVRNDWLRYANLAPIVAFHDIVGHTQKESVTGRRVEVPRLWTEIKASGIPTIEFIGEGSTMGIGICFPRSA